MADNLLLYTAVYDNVGGALADLKRLEELHDQDMIGKYDAAVVDKKDGDAHIVKRLDRPRVRVIPESFGGGNLPRKELKEAAQELSSEEAALIVVGEPTFEEGFSKAISGAAKSVKRTLDATVDELASDLQQALKEPEEQKS